MTNKERAEELARTISDACLEVEIQTGMRVEAHRYGNGTVDVDLVESVELKAEGGAS